MSDTNPIADQLIDSISRHAACNDGRAHLEIHHEGGAIRQGGGSPSRSRVASRR